MDFPDLLPSDDHRRSKTRTSRKHSTTDRHSSSRTSHRSKVSSYSSSKSKKAPKPWDDVIDLCHEPTIPEEDEDALLDELLDDNEMEPHEEEPHYVSLQKRSHTADTSRNTDSDVSDQDLEEDYNEYSEEDEEGSLKSFESEETATLLEQAHDRLHLQQLQDQVKELHEKLERKNVELETLTGQLRRAVATKCDLVLAHTELELHHEQNLKRKDEGLNQLKKTNFGLVEAQSEVEKDLLNEICELTNKMKHMEQTHRQEIKDWDLAHQNEIAQKDYKIAKLEEEIRKLKFGGQSNSGPGMCSAGSLFSGILTHG